jgi:hypothetical protein
MPLSSDLVQIGFSSRESDFLGDTQSNSISLAGTTQGAGVPITSSINRITGGTGGVDDAATLPLAANFKGSFIAIRSDFIGFAAQIFPGVGDSINGLAANAAYSLAAGTGILLFKISSTSWIVVG